MGKYTSLLVLGALFTASAVDLKSHAHSHSNIGVRFAPAAPGPYASDTDHMSVECYGADEDDIMYDVFERFRVEEKNPMGQGTGIWNLPKNSGPEWSADILEIQRDERGQD